MRASKLIALAFVGLMFTVSVAHANEPSAAAADDASKTSDVVSATAEDDKMVCEYEKKVGSHMKTRVCKTVAQRRQEREQAEKAMSSRTICGNCRGD